MTDRLPARTDVLVIGGGIAGCALAYYLAGEGVDVVLLERHDLNTQASGSNAGSIHAQIPQHEFLHLGEAWARQYAPVIPLMMQSITLWRGLGEELDAPIEVSLDGGLLVARTEAQLAAIRAKAAIEREYGLEVVELSRADLRQVAPYIADDMIGATLCPSEGKANPLLVTPAFARRAEARGALILRHVELTGLARDGAGFAGMTSAGPIAARRVVNCAGADAARIATMLGLRVALEGHAIQVSVTTPVAPLVPHLVYYAGGQLTLKQAAMGAFLIGGGWPASWDEGRLRINPDSLRANLRLAASVVPALREMELLRAWPAVVNGTADWRPLLGEVPSLRGFFMCCFPWTGFSAGPIVARGVADLVLGRPASAEMRPFLMDR